MSERASFGLSPRVPNSARQQQQQPGGSAYPRTAASPKIVPGFQQPASFAFPTPAAAAAQFASHQSTPQGGQYSSSGSTRHYDDHGYDPQQMNKRRAAGHDQPQYSNGHGGQHQYAQHQPSLPSNWGESFSNGSGQANGTREQYSRGATHGGLTRDRENEELTLWKKQQAALEAHAAKTKRNRYLLYALASAAVLFFLYWLGLQTSGSSGPELAPSSGDASGVPISPPSGDGLGAPVDEESRRVLAELTRSEMESEHQELFELDPSALTSVRTQDPASEAVAKLDPVTRATAVVPQPPKHADMDSSEPDQQAMDEPPEARGGAASVALDEASKQRLQRLQLNGGRPEGEEDPDLLLRLAEAQRMAQLENEKAALDAQVAGVRRNKDRHNPLDDPLGLDDDESASVDGGLQHPAPSQINHIMIEQLIHEGTREGETIRPHSHKDHPTVPKYGAGIPAVPMPADPKAGKKAASASPAAATPAASTDDAALGRKKKSADSAAAAAVAEAAAAAVESDAHASEDELLSELSKASRPGDLSTQAEVAASKENKKTGMKGPVLRGANAEAHALPAEAAAVAEGEQEAVESTTATTATKKKAVPTTTTATKKPRAKGMDPKAKAAASKAWKALAGQTMEDTVEWELPDPSDTSAAAASKKKKNYLFGSDVQFIVFTSAKTQALARKLKSLYAPLIKRLMFVSDRVDRGLNATVLANPHPSWSIHRNPAGKDSPPWRITELLRHLGDRTAFPRPAKFYIVMHDQTFPLLDQLAWKLAKYREVYGGLWPNFAGGKKTAQVAKEPFWKDQIDLVKKTFGKEGKKLFVAPTYMYGFDQEFVDTVSEYASSDVCPVLPTEGLSLAGLVECAGGALPRTEFEFITQTRSNHREKKIDKDAATLSEWRHFDAFNACNTPGMLQEAFDAYYGKLKKDGEEETSDE